MGQKVSSQVWPDAEAWFQDVGLSPSSTHTRSTTPNTTTPSTPTDTFSLTAIGLAPTGQPTMDATLRPAPLPATPTTRFTISTSTSSVTNTTPSLTSPSLSASTTHLDPPDHWPALLAHATYFARIYHRQFPTHLAHLPLAAWGPLDLSDAATRGPLRYYRFRRRDEFDDTAMAADWDGGVLGWELIRFLEGDGEEGEDDGERRAGGGGEHQGLFQDLRQRGPEWMHCDVLKVLVLSCPENWEEEWKQRVWGAMCLAWIWVIVERFLVRDGKGQWAMRVDEQGWDGAEGPERAENAGEGEDGEDGEAWEDLSEVVLGQEELSGLGYLTRMTGQSHAAS